jgi:hypothetical protein
MPDPVAHGYWKLDNNLNDATAGGRNGAGTVVYSTDAILGTHSLIGGRPTLAGNNVLAEVADGRTMGFWCKWVGPLGEAAFGARELKIRNAADNAVRYLKVVMTDEEGFVEIRGQSNAVSLAINVIEGSPPDEIWHLAVLRFTDSGTGDLWWDGASVASGAFVVENLNATGAVVEFGVQAGDSDENVAIDEAFIGPYLTEAQIVALYNSRAGLAYPWEFPADSPPAAPCVRLGLGIGISL